MVSVKHLYLRNYAPRNTEVLYLFKNYVLKNIFLMLSTKACSKSSEVNIERCRLRSDSHCILNNVLVQ